MIVGLGTAFFAGLKAAAPDMKNTADLYYDNYNMMDIRVLSTMGLTDEDIEAMKLVAGVETVQPSYFADVVTTIHSNECVFRIHALPAAVGKIREGPGRYAGSRGTEKIRTTAYLWGAGRALPGTVRFELAGRPVICLHQLHLVGPAIHSRLPLRQAEWIPGRNRS